MHVKLAAQKDYRAKEMKTHEMYPSLSDSRQRRKRNEMWLFENRVLHLQDAERRKKESTKRQQAKDEARRVSRLSRAEEFKGVYVCVCSCFCLILRSIVDINVVQGHKQKRRRCVRLSKLGLDRSKCTAAGRRSGPW